MNQEQAQLNTEIRKIKEEEKENNDILVCIPNWIGLGLDYFRTVSYVKSIFMILVVKREISGDECQRRA